VEKVTPLKTDKNLEKESIIDYNINIKIVIEIPEVFDTPVILNLHDQKGIPIIRKRMSGRRLQRKAEAYVRLPT